MSLVDEPGAGQAAEVPVLEMPYRERLRMVREFHIGGERARDAGPVVRIDLGPARLGIPQIVFVCSPAGMRDALAGFDGTFDKETIVHRETRVWGDNSFNMPYAPWKPRRRALQPAFVKKNVETYAEQIDVVAAQTAERWLVSGEVDLAGETRRLTLGVLGRSVFGVDLEARATDLGPCVAAMIRYPADRALAVFRSPAWLPTPGRARLRAAMQPLRQVASDAIAATRADPEHQAPLVRELLELVDPETGKPLTDQAIVDELLAFLIAGHDTTATTLAYALWQLARQPAMQERTADEALALGDRPLTPADVHALPYTMQVLHEALRLAPPGAGVGRLAMKDAVVDGHRIPAGTNLFLSIFALHRHPDLWEDPLRFDPDRFEVSRMRSLDRWQYLPFGGGPRSCIGDHFAMLEACLAAATLLQRLRFETDQVDFPLAVPFTLVAGGPVRVRVSAR